MIIFDEKKYAERILRNKEYETLKNQGQERCAIVRYLKFEKGYDDEQIMATLLKLPMSRDVFLSEEDKKKIYRRIINKSPQYEYNKDIVVNIYKTELDIINSIEDKSRRDLLFCCLVYYKWGKCIFSRSFYSKINNVVMVLEDDDNLYKIAKLMNLRKKDRQFLFNALLKEKLYVQDIIKGKNYFYIPFSKDKGKDLCITISRYNNILGELYFYNKEEGYKRCVRCGDVIKKNNNKQKYCNNCARLANIENTSKNINLK
nr:MAG TPA: hypothetical protein [Caudoviricetes sp.]